MKFKILLMLLGTTLFLKAQQPVAPINIVTDEYFGQKVDDPYRYLEDMKDSTVVNWFKGQGDYTNQVLSLVNGSDAKTKQFEEFADIFSFTFWQMGHPDYQSIRQKEKSLD